MYMCSCKAIKESDVRELARQGASNTTELIEALGLHDDDCCGTCLLRIDEYEEVARREWQQASTTDGGSSR